MNHVENGVAQTLQCRQLLLLPLPYTLRYPRALIVDTPVLPSAGPSSLQTLLIDFLVTIGPPNVKVC